jgi:hypothetical protein
MANTLFKDEDLNTALKEHPWKKKVIAELEARKTLENLKITPVTGESELHMYDPANKFFNQAHLFMMLKPYGFFVGFYIKKGLLWSKTKDEVMTPDWYWQYFLHLLSTKSSFRNLFDFAIESHKMGIRLEGGPRKEFIYRANMVDWGNIMAVLNTWPVNLHCDFYFEKYVDKKKIMENTNEQLFLLWTEIFELVVPIYKETIVADRTS